MTKKDWPEKEPRNIIVRMPNWLGDLVMATPVLADLRNKWKNAKITAMCQTNVADLLTADPHIDEILRFRRPNGWLRREEHQVISTALRHGKYDLGILLTNSFSSAWKFWQGSVQNRLGFATNWRSLFLSKALPFPKEKETQHQVLTYKMLLEPLGISPSDSDPTLYVTDEEKQEALQLLEKLDVIKGTHRIVGVNPGAAYGSAKCWPPERFQEVSRNLLEDPSVRILYFGDPGGAPLVRLICKDLPEQVIDLAGKTSLRQLLALIGLCDAFLTNDSGPMHIAAALKTPLLAIFGSTSAVKTGPYKWGQIIHKHVSCSPCYKRVCPIDFRCMKRITSTEVTHQLQGLLSGKQ